MRYKQHCPLCERHGIDSYLNTFQINFQEAVLLCENEKCLYPIGLPDENGTIKRGLGELSSGRDVPPSSQTLLHTSQPPRLEWKNRPQMAVFGTQTGTPLNGLKTSLKKSPATLGHFVPHLLPNMQANGVHNGISPLANTIHPGIYSNGINQTSVNLNLVKTGCRSTSIQNNRPTPYQPFEFGQLQKSNGNAGTTALNENLQITKDKKKKSIETLLKFCNTNDNKGSDDVNGFVNNDTDELKNLLCHGGKTVPVKPREDDRSYSKCVFPQWLNRDSLCWLDVTLCLLVHNSSVRKLLREKKMDENCVIYKLIKAHEQVRSMINRVPSSQTNANTVNKKVKRKRKLTTRKTKGALNDAENRLADGKEISSELNQPVSDEVLKQGQDMMEVVREQVWLQIQGKLRCEKDRPESPVFAMPLVLRINTHLEKLFKMRYRFYCSNCDHSEENEYENTMPTFPSVVEDFTMQEPQHQRQCFRCGYNNGYRTLKYKKLSRCLLMHFVDGFPSTCWSRLQFGFHGNQYVVTGVIQYIHQPDHFIVWLRDPTTNQWAECNDLGHMVCEFGATEPQFPSNQVHIVMWEKQAVEKTGANLRLNSHGLSNTSVINAYSGAIPNPMPMESAELGRILVCKTCKSNKDKTLCEICQNTLKIQRYKKVPQTNSYTTVCSTGMGLESSETRHEMPSLSTLQNHTVVCQPEQAIDLMLCQTAGSTSTTSTPCSSLSTLSDTSVDSGILPDFSVFAHEYAGVDRPMPSKLDVLGLSSLGTTTQSPAASEDNTPGKVKRSTAVLNLMKKYNSRGGHITTTNPAVNRTIGDNVNLPCRQQSLSVSSNSAFSLPQRSNKWVETFNVCDDQSIQPCFNGKVKTVIPSIGKLGRRHTDTDSVKSSSSRDSKSKSNTTLSVSRFKMPPFKKQTSFPTLSKDVFKTFKPIKSENCLSKPVSPAFASVGSNQYLSTVKQYLIGRTTGGTDVKPQYEGLILKSAPGLTRRISLPDAESPFSDSSLSEAKKCFQPFTDIKSLSVGRPAKKRTSTDAISAVLKKITKKSTGSAISGVDGSQSGENQTLKTCMNGNDTKQANVINNCRYSMNGTKSIGNTDNYGLCSDSLKENTVNGLTVRELSRTPMASKPIADTSESDCVLQDLYEALNIPFKSVPQTMSDIMVDVSDILGIADTCRLVPESEGTRTGNQTSLDCALTMASRTQA